MEKSRIISGIVFVWKKLVEIYDASFIAKIINSICSFCSSRASGSAIVRAFKHGICSKEYWENSFVFRFFSFFVKGRSSEIKTESSFVKGLRSILYIPLRLIGFVILAYAFPMCGVVLIRTGTKMSVLISAVLCALGVLFLLFRQSIYEIFQGSRFLSFFGGFFSDEFPDRERVIPSLKAPLTVAFFLGLVSGMTEVLWPVGILVAFLCVLVILSRFEIGVFLIILSVAFLPTSAVAALSALTIAGFVYALIKGRVKNISPSILAPGIALYVLFSVFSTATSFNLSSSAFIFAVYTVFILTYVVIVNTLTTPKRWKAAVTALACVSVFIALYGIFQYYFIGTTSASWVDSTMFQDIKTRVFSTFDNPNVLGQYFILIMPLALALFCAEKKPLRKTAWLCVLAVDALCLLYTWSRGAWLGVMLGIVIFFLIRDKRWVFLCILLLIAAPFILPESILARFTSLGNTADSSTAYRVSIWTASLRMAKDFWMNGVGFGSDSFATVYQNYTLNGASYALHSHNFYIQLVVEMGIGGLISILIVMFNTVTSVINIKKEDRTVRAVSLAVVGILCGFLFQGIAESMWYNLRMALLFWIIAAFAVTGVRCFSGKDGEKGD